MKTDGQLIERFLELQEHPGQMTDKQLQQALDDTQMRELVELMALAKRAFKNEELQAEEPDVDGEWEKFTAKNFGEEHITHDCTNSSIVKFRKIAATFVGIIFAFGIAFAAIHIVRIANSPEIRHTEQSVLIKSSVLAKGTINADTTEAKRSVVFDNVLLEKMLPEIADYYQVEVSFQNDTVRQLRFHFVWKPADGLEHAIEKLNRFESLSLKLNENIIIVE